MSYLVCKSSEKLPILWLLTHVLLNRFGVRGSGLALPNGIAHG